MTETQIMTFFSVYGQVSLVEIEKCPTTGGSLGIAHVHFENDANQNGHACACQAIEKGNGRKMGSAEGVKVCFDATGKYQTKCHFCVCIDEMIHRRQIKSSHHGGNRSPIFR